jgi:hypothetical protein
VTDEHRVAIQPAIPDFEGEKVHNEVIKVSGEFSQPHGSEPIRRRREYFAIVRLHTDEVGHKPDSDGFLQRVTKAKFYDAVIIDKGAGEELQRQWRDENMRRIHERSTQQVMSELQEGLAIDLSTDSGTVTVDPDSELPATIRERTPDSTDASLTYVGGVRCGECNNVIMITGTDAATDVSSYEHSTGNELQDRKLDNDHAAYPIPEDPSGP